MGMLFTGIPGINYFFSIGIALWICTSFLIFEGRRWRLFLTVFIFILLTFPVYVMGVPYDVSARIPGILNALLADIIFNSFYLSSKKKNRLLHWTVIAGILFLLQDIIIRVLMYPIFYSIEYVMTFLNVTLWLLPVILIEGLVGAYLGFKIYQVIKDLTITKSLSPFNEK
jgi:hypothetical protein